MTVLRVPALSTYRDKPSLGPQIASWMEHFLVHGPGDVRGHQYRLDDEKRKVLFGIYALQPDGRRRFKRAGVSVRKGWAKTELAAAIAAVELHPDAPARFHHWAVEGETSHWGYVYRLGEPVGVGVRDPYVPMVAYTEEQSEELAYGALVVMLGEGPLGQDFDIGLERIIVLDDQGRAAGKAVALATSPDSRDGARTTFQVFDEPLALDTPVITIDGWSTIGEIADGDYVYGRDGSPIRVLGASPTHDGRECYRVTFVGGDSIVTDASHRWAATDTANRPRGEQIVSTKQMLERGVDVYGGKRWRLPHDNGYNGSATDLPIDPYLLGMWLGDGATNAGYIHSHVDDYAEIASSYPHTVANDPSSTVVRWLPTGLRRLLRLNGLLGHKHIPSAYMLASRQQRTELLRGLMDSDGHTTSNGHCTFVQGKVALIEQVRDLLRSLGVTASVCSQDDKRSHTGVMLKVHFTPEFCPFSLQRKANRAPWFKRQRGWPVVESIVPVDSVPVRCIAVDSDDHLFIAGLGLRLTHNTHRLTLPRLKQAHQTMMANLPKRKAADAWSLEITTSYEPGELSVAEGTMDYARLVRAGKVPDSRLFFYHRQAGDGHDLTTTEGLRNAVLEACGDTAAWTDVDGIVELALDPQTDRSYWERVWLNRLVQSASQVFDMSIVDSAAHPKWRPEDGEWITVGFDGAMTRDATALVGTHIASGRQFLLALWECPTNAKGEPDRDWQVPEDEVDQAVEETFRRWNVWRLYADPYYWDTHVSTWVGKYTVKRGNDRGTPSVFSWPTNTHKKMALSVKAFLHSMKHGEWSFDGNPRFRTHLANTRKHNINILDDDGVNLFVMRKERPDSLFKIDVAMAACLSWEAYRDAIAAGVNLQRRSRLPVSVM